MEFIFTTAAAIVIFAYLSSRKITVFEYQRGVNYNRGHLKTVLEPGKYFLFSPNDTVQVVDIRPRVVTVPGQEIISADGVGVKVTMSAEFAVADPAAAVNAVENYQQSTYVALQLALREIIGEYKIEEVMTSRKAINAALLEKASGRTATFGVTLITAAVKDLMFPGEVKKIFTQVVQAQKEGLAALEKARGETAALRQLANAARMLESNPALLKLKLLQATGNTLMVGWPEQLVPSPIKDRKTQ